jgi:hypothetical protein
MTKNHFSFPERLIELSKIEIHKIELLCEVFTSNKSYKSVFRETDPLTGERVQKLKFTCEPPEDISIGSYRVLCDLRHALDKATHAASVTIGTLYPKKTNFPIRDTKKNFEGAWNAGKKSPYRGIPDALRPYIEELQPYPTSCDSLGGNDALHLFCSAANAEKHQISATAAITLSEVSIKAPYGPVNMAGIRLTSSKEWRASSNGEFELFRTALPVKDRFQIYVPTFVAFDLGSAVAGMDIPSTLRDFASMVEGIVLGLKAETDRIVVARS